MKRLALIFLVPFNVWAGTPQVALPSGNASINTSLVTTAQVFGMSGGMFDATFERNTGIMASAGTFSNFGICITPAPGVGKSFTFALQLGSRNADSSLGCAISGTETCCYDVADSSSVVAGDLVRLEATPSGTPTAVTGVSYRVNFMPSVDDQYVVTGAQTSNSASTTYIQLAGAVGARTTLTDTAIPMPHNGRFNNFYVELSTAPGVGNSWAFTLMAAGVATSVTCTVSGTARTCNDLTNSTDTVRGNSAVIRMVPSGAPTATYTSVGLRYVPVNRGEFPFLGNTFNAISAAANSYTNLQGGNNNNASELITVSTAASPSPGLIIKNGTYSVTTAPGASKSYTYTLRKNFANPTGGPSATISGTNTTAQSDGYIVVSEGDKIVNQLAPSGTPTAGMFHAGYTGYFTQPLMTPVFP